MDKMRSEWLVTFPSFGWLVAFFPWNDRVPIRWRANGRFMREGPNNG